MFIRDFDISIASLEKLRAVAQHVLKQNMAEAALS